MKSKKSKNAQRKISEKKSKTFARKKQRAQQIEIINRRPGRPTDFKAEFIEQAYQLTLLGMTLEEMAKIFDVAYTTVCKWKEKVPEFDDAIRRGGAIADGKVVDALYKNALGHAGEKIFYDQKEGTIVRADTYHKPDPVSGIFWMKNRQPHLWRDRHDFTSSDGSFTAFSESMIESSKGLESKLRKEKANGNGTSHEE